VIGLFEPRTGSGTLDPLVNAFNLAGLGLLTWGVTSEAHLGLGGSHLAALLLLIAAVSSWLAWTFIGFRPGRTPIKVAILLIGAGCGGVLIHFAGIALIFPAVASFRATMEWPIVPAIGVAAAGWIAMLIVTAATSGDHYGNFFIGLAVSFGAMVTGSSRRQAVLIAEQNALIRLEKDRTEVERARAELLAERNHLARELHDVLAHTLAALSVQLEAFDTVVEADPMTAPAVHDQLAKTKTLVREGLNEARGAVRALRENSAPLADQLQRLCAEQNATMSVSGVPRPLSPQITLNLYRVTQEALTNVVKHAPGAPTSVDLVFKDDGVSLIVENAASPSSTKPLATTGAGYGLQGITERLELIGGRVVAGPTNDGWRIATEVPIGK
jgi:signal transduction histidine kinase